MARINFFTEDVVFKVPTPRKTTTWISAAVKKESAAIDSLNYIFCSDTYLLEINKQYLSHSTFTDIVTFDNREPSGTGPIEADIYISVDRVSENARKFKTSFEVELRRVMIHGILHLLGYSDKNAYQKAVMRKKEDAYLSLFPG